MAEATRQRRVLLVVDHRRNRELLEDWLARDETLAPAECEEGFDVVVFDGTAFARRREWLRELRREQQPLYVPCLLITPHRDVSFLTRELWRDVDELITTPIRSDELRVRLERLLTLREQSLQTIRSNTDLQQFAFVAAHELSTPLTVVAGVIETVLTRYGDGLEADVANLLKAARSSANRLQHLIDDLLGYSRAGTAAELGPVDLGEIVPDAVTQLAEQIELSGAEIEVGELPVVLGNVQQLRLVFANLVGNAIKYRQPGETPAIRVGAQRKDDVWCVWVEDNGIGIEPDRAEAVFGMFERNQHDGDRPGSGIGLALCRRIVERHGGDIWIEQPGERGTLVKFSLRPAE